MYLYRYVQMYVRTYVCTVLVGFTYIRKCLSYTIHKARWSQDCFTHTQPYTLTNSIVHPGSMGTVTYYYIYSGPHLGLVLDWIHWCHWGTPESYPVTGHGPHHSPVSSVERLSPLGIQWASWRWLPASHSGLVSLSPWSRPHWLQQPKTWAPSPVSAEPSTDLSIIITMYVYIVHYRPLCIYVHKYSSIPVIHVIHICIRTYNACIHSYTYMHNTYSTMYVHSTHG